MSEFIDIIKDRFNFKWESFIISIIIGGAFGIFQGITMWKQNERDYLKYFNNKNNI